ncbi:MAG TPA: DNA translocase FtsK 4TM domain-containing protein [Chloroflexota bacterium]
MATSSTIHLGPPPPADHASRPWDKAGPLALLLAAFLAIIVFWPPEGRISGPLHEACNALLGRAAFMLPLVCAFVGVLCLARTLRPDVRLPARRLTGIVVLLVAVLSSEHLLAGGRGGTGLIGDWLSSLFLDLLGSAITVLVLLTALVVGTMLAFDVRLRLARPPRPAVEEPRAES